MPRVRFTVRRMTLVVAVLAVVVWGARMWQVSAAHQRRAMFHSLLAWRYARQPMRPWLASRHAALASKYRRAARYPWLPVEPNPPEPR
jgi:hypothetical protein